MKKSDLASFFVGLFFALGLGISGMTQPARIIGFLDVFGAWDPSLIFVMGGAVGVHAVAYRLIRRRRSPLFSTKWHLPEKTGITPALLGGAFLFGVGWGLSGYCPGPAIVSIPSLDPGLLVFIASMVAGMQLSKIKRPGKPAAHRASSSCG